MATATLRTAAACVLCTEQIHSKSWRSIHSEANLDVFCKITSMIIQMFGSKSADIVFPTGSVLWELPF